MDRFLEFLNPLSPLWNISLNKAYVIKWILGKHPLPLPYAHGLKMTPYLDQQFFFYGPYQNFDILKNPFSQIQCERLFFSMELMEFLFKYQNYDPLKILLNKRLG